MELTKEEMKRVIIALEREIDFVLKYSETGEVGELIDLINKFKIYLNRGTTKWTLTKLLVQKLTTSR